MATENVNITVAPIGQVNITASAGVVSSVSANDISYDPTGTDFPNDTLTIKTAIDRLAGEQFASDGQPASAEEGAVWYDTDDDRLYVRKNNEWVEILVDGITTLDGGDGF